MPHDVTRWGRASGFLLFAAALTACGGSGGVPVAGASATAAASVSVAAPTVRVQGAHLVDGSGNTVFLHGVNVSGLESVAVQGYDSANPWGGLTGTPTPNWATIKTWNVNAVRLPLNEASWLGYTCTDANGMQRNPDPGHNYQATVAQSVADASAAGLYVILDLHWSAPKTYCPLAQNLMADADNSVTFWSQVATAFKSYPNVIFELFNEPALSNYVQGSATDWQVLLQGGALTQYHNENGFVSLVWQAAGMQQLLDAVRATGATNVVLTAGLQYAGDLGQWLANMPADPLRSLGAVWHAYPAYGTTFGTAAYAAVDPVTQQNALNIMTAGVPVVITETGDQNSTGTVGSPYVSTLLPWADQSGISYLGWTWDDWNEPNFTLIKDAAGTPTDGYGAYFKAHLLCVATGRNCL